MTTRLGWVARATTMFNDNSKGPWGGRGGGNGGGDGSGGGGPRNPWNMPPSGGRPRGPGPSALDELLKRARGGLGPNLPRTPGSRQMWLIGGAVLVLLWLFFTSVHRIGPQEEGVVLRLGQYSHTIQPGIGLTLPAPIDTVQVVDVRVIRTENFPEGTGAAAENLMITGDQNIINLAYSVRWNIRDPERYLFQIADPQSTVRATAESAMRAAVANITLDEAIGAGRGAVEQEVQRETQRLLDGYRTGIRLQGVAIKQADPPATVIDAFKAVIGSQQAAQAEINQARAYAQQTTAYAQGQSAAFDKVYAEYRLAPEVTRRRMYYETMEKVLGKVDKTIVEAPGVTPYLPLPSAAGRSTPAPTVGAGQ